MSVTISQTESLALTLMRDFLISILPAGTEVIRAQVNRTPEPQSPNFVVMTPSLRTQIETTTTTYADNGTGSDRSDVQPTQFSVQIDFHGPSAGDNTQIFATLFRSDYATSAFSADANLPSGAGDIIPLYHSDPRQLPFIDGEGQYEERWTIDACLQVNPVISSVVQSATAVSVGIIEVDATYPPDSRFSIAFTNSFY